MRAPFVVAVAAGSRFKPQSLSFCWPLLPLLQVEPFGLSDQSQAVAVKMDAQVSRVPKHRVIIVHGLNNSQMVNPLFWNNKRSRSLPFWANQKGLVNPEVDALFWAGMVDFVRILSESQIDFFAW